MTADTVSEAAASPEDEFPTGYIRDFISGKPVKASPEETEAVQVFARRLVEDLGYPKDRITTRPQFRVRPRPSEGPSRGYPVDIAVFSSSTKHEDEAYLLVECKRPTRQDGEKQLRLYLSMSSAQIGVWFNGKDHLYLHKKYRPDGTLEWKVLPTLPKCDQSITDIGLLRREDLTTPTNLKAIFRDLRNHLAGNTTGITRDQALAQEMMSILFCKIYDEIETAPKDLPAFRAAADESSAKIAKRIKEIFSLVKNEYSDVFEANEIISLDSESLKYVVGELQNYQVTKASRDAIGEAFEVFIGPAVRGEEGQFFTPRNVVQMMVKLLDPKPGEKIIDPACGSGGFLIVALEHIWSQLEVDAKHKGWTASQLERKQLDIASRCMRGIDKDSFLTKVSKAYMAIIGDGRGGIFCEDSLGEPSRWKEQVKDKIELGKFDVVLTNPPFGSKIKVTGAHKLAQYILARKWKAPRAKGTDWEPTTAHQLDCPPSRNSSFI